MTYGGAYNEQRFSKLKQIDRETVKTLGLKWFADYDTNLDQRGSPLYVDGVIYVSTAWSKCTRSTRRPARSCGSTTRRSRASGCATCCGNVNRGIAAYNGKIYLGTLDARLVAIDAKTGKEAWSTDTIKGDHSDPLNRYSITMAPRVARGKVFIGTLRR